MRNPLKILILTGCILICSNSFAGSGVADAIFKAEQFSYDTLSPLVRNEEISVDWPDGDRFFHYSLEDSSGVRHFVVSTRTWKKEMVFDSGVMSSRIAGLLENERVGVAIPDGPLFIYSVTFVSFSITEAGHSDMTAGKTFSKRPRLPGNTVFQAGTVTGTRTGLRTVCIICMLQAIIWSCIRSGTGTASI